jgi:hypothetical protein
MVKAALAAAKAVVMAPMTPHQTAGTRLLRVYAEVSRSRRQKIGKAIYFNTQRLACTG